MFETLSKTQIKVIQFFENYKIMECQLVDASLDLSADLARGTECILVIDRSSVR